MVLTKNSESPKPESMVPKRFSGKTLDRKPKTLKPLNYAELGTLVKNSSFFRILVANEN